MNTKDFLENYEKISNNLLENVFFPLNKKKEILNEEDNVKWGVFATGGSIGSNNKKPYKIFTDKEEAKEYAKRMRKLLSPGERKYYKMGYSVRPIKEII